MSHLAESVHWTGGHRQVSNMSDLRGITLEIREERPSLYSLLVWQRSQNVSELRVVTM